jgi:hypothetical protein
MYVAISHALSSRGLPQARLFRDAEFSVEHGPSISPDDRVSFPTIDRATIVAVIEVFRRVPGDPAHRVGERV